MKYYLEIFHIIKAINPIGSSSKIQSKHFYKKIYINAYKPPFSEIGYKRLIMTDLFQPFQYKRIVVVGVTGCGKSVLAENLSRKLGLKFIELDALYWKPGWFESSLGEFRRIVTSQTALPSWALAGNYSQVRDITWKRAEAIVWMDYSYPMVFQRLFRRTWHRWRTHELLWGTNYERLWPQFKFWSKDSLFAWQVYSYARHKRLYPSLFHKPEYSHLKIFRFKTQSATEKWLASLVSTYRSAT
jgi:hypothetical protein